MTKNQIDYQRQVETERANRAQEELGRLNYEENKRSHLAQEEEARRANLARELENNRTNVVNEGLKAQQNAEANRSNLANEMLKSQANIETNRSNLANEAIKRSQIASNERLGYAQIASNEGIANANRSSQELINREKNETTITAANVRNPEGALFMRGANWVESTVSQTAVDSALAQLLERQAARSGQH